jgi:preprotein translocase subunit SecD
MGRLSPSVTKLSILAVVVAIIGADAAAASAQAASAWSWLEPVWSWYSGRNTGAARQRAETALKSQGGSRVLLKVDTDAVRAAMLIELRDGLRRQLREDRIAFAELAVREGSVQVRIREPKDFERTRSKLATWWETTASGESTLDIRDSGDGTVRLTPTDRGFADRLQTVHRQSMGVIERRLAGFGAVSPGVSAEGPDAIRVLLPGVTDAAGVSAVLSKRARITFRHVDESMTAEEALRGNPPPGSEILYLLNDRSPLLLRKQVAMEGEDLADAAPGFDQRTTEPIVTFRFNARGTRQFAQLTQENVGRPFAIVLDNDVLSAPIIREPIVGGSGQISGGFTVEAANTIAVLLRSGTLPGRLIVAEQQKVEPEGKAAKR